MTNELGRKAVHVLAGVIILLGAIYFDQNYTLDFFKMILFGLLVISLFIDFLIADMAIKVPIYHIVQRRKELSGLHSASFFLIGSVLALQFFNLEIALTAIGIMSLGDCVAALVGKKWGKPFFRKKSIHGSAAMFLISLLVGYLFLSNPVIIIFMAVVGTAVEIFVDNIDDNIMIPVFSGLAGQVIVLLL